MICQTKISFNSVPLLSYFKHYNPRFLFCRSFLNITRWSLVPITGIYLAGNYFLPISDYCTIKLSTVAGAVHIWKYHLWIWFKYGSRCWPYLPIACVVVNYLFSLLHFQFLFLAFLVHSDNTQCFISLPSLFKFSPKGPANYLVTIVVPILVVIEFKSESYSKKQALLPNTPHAH